MRDWYGERLHDAAATPLLAAAAQAAVTDDDLPGLAWRRQWSLLVGLQRLLSEDHPALADGTLLRTHQLDALTGIQAALVDVLSEDDGSWSPLVEDADAEIVDATTRRLWFEHATGSGKTVSAIGLVEASRTGGVLILTHRHALVRQFTDELEARGYGERLRRPLHVGEDALAPVTVATYQWFVRHAGTLSDAYTLVICDEAHQALGPSTARAIRAWSGPLWVGMTATGTLLSGSVADLFPAQTSRFDLGAAARAGVIAPLRAVRIPLAPGRSSMIGVPLRRGRHEQEFDAESLGRMLDVDFVNHAFAALYAERFGHLPGIVYAAGVVHAEHVAAALRAQGLSAVAVSGETPHATLASVLDAYDDGDLDVLVNAQLLTEGWDSPRACVCVHLAPTASPRVYQQRVGRVTRRDPGKEAGIVVDFVEPGLLACESPVVTLHGLLACDHYREGALVVGRAERARPAVAVAKDVVPLVDHPPTLARYALRVDATSMHPSLRRAWFAAVSDALGPGDWKHLQRRHAACDAWPELLEYVLRNADGDGSSTVRVRAWYALLKAAPQVLTPTHVEVFAALGKAHRLSVAWSATDARSHGVALPDATWWAALGLVRPRVERWLARRWPQSGRALGALVATSGSAQTPRLRALCQAARSRPAVERAAMLAVAQAYDAPARAILERERALVLADHGEEVAERMRAVFPQAQNSGGGPVPSESSAASAAA